VGIDSDIVYVNTISVDSDDASVAHNAAAVDCESGSVDDKSRLMMCSSLLP
jgi:hypothetical protein